MNPLYTGAAAFGGAQLGAVVSYGVSLLHIAPPPADVAGTIGAMLLVGGHLVVNWLNARATKPAAETPKVAA